MISKQKSAPKWRAFEIVNWMHPSAPTIAARTNLSGIGRVAGEPTSGSPAMNAEPAKQFTHFTCPLVGRWRRGQREDA